MDDGNGTSMGPGEGAAPSVNVLAQYVKDFSFENPNAPQSLQPREAGPQLNINVNVGARPLSATEFEVDLSLQARAGQGAEVIFAVELVYSGLFRITNVPEEHLHPFVLIECPRLLFPFARQIVADATRNGGFPPLMIDPIDFVALYQQNLAQAQAGQPN
ncbi:MULTISPECIES: protein-export chaperone SecB [Hyphomicrobiales]|uniref:Protein-export protein SecB n=3 Tax=Prosthecodimorpha TaxID=2981530 RepID=A0A0P6VRA0_9HYPH|nr:MULTISPECIES: protein-export chaperone SecB [Hyphomicrobiales]KPL53110.1 preprotein translocase subunit SecB [Prosthecomicrobium hirschii]MBT9290848.1 protein-export chaperone SecB [Prosthecodimorpha staleyi]MCW1842107.1 protein-export chaperone SecB [Prosthecomicrobium hirschii]